MRRFFAFAYLHAQADQSAFLVKLYTYLLCFFVLLPELVAAQTSDTLQNIDVHASTGKNAAVTSSPVQILNSTEISRRNSLSVADAVKYFAGIHVKDYGGIGGLKTVSVRSLGANHTGVLYDGIAVGDAQGGQIDLGKFSIDNVEEIGFYNSGPTEILSTARSFASSSIISLKTNGEKVTRVDVIRAGNKFGSFGLFAPSVSVKKYFGKRFHTALNAYYQYSKGNYPYKAYENDQTFKNRANADIKSYKIEYDAALFLNDSNSLKIKAYHFNSDRGLPGAVILINNFSNQRLTDKNFFIQSSWLHQKSEKSSMLVSGKFSSDIIIYTDPQFPNNSGRLENNFNQQEIYLSASYKYNITDHLATSVSADAFNSTLGRTDSYAAGFANPDRNTFLNNIAVQWKKSSFEVSGNVLYTAINEKVTNGKAGRNLHEYSPAVSVSVKPFTDVPVRIRGFYKNIFRAPTFNDLYYTLVGNTDLRPEYAAQFNAGLTYSMSSTGLLQRCVFTADGYINSVKDKILAVPRQNLFQWSMQNVGKAYITGSDITLHTIFKNYRDLHFSTRLSYSFQDADNRSDVTSSLYKTQLPYTPKHSGSLNLNAEFKKTVISYNMLMSSLRYRAGNQAHENAIQGQVISDITVSHIKSTKGGECKITAEANNVFNTQYEIIKYYPMPRFNYRIGLKVTSKY